MATIRDGKRSALMIVDMQVGVMGECWEAAAKVRNAAQVVERARARGVPVLWVQHADDESLVEGTAAWQWVPELQPVAGETRIHKRFNSSFEATPLDDELARLGVSHLVLAGAASNWCIRATAYGALERGYDLTLVKDAHTTGSMDLGNGRRVEAQSVIDDLNLAMTWLEYPGRKSAAVAAGEVDFAPPGAKS